MSNHATNSINVNGVNWNKGEDRPQQDKTYRRLKTLDTALAAALIILIILLCQSVWFTDQSLLVLGAPEPDTHAYADTPDPATQDSAASTDAAPDHSSLQYALSATVEGSQVSMFFKNPADSGVGLVVCLMVTDANGTQDCVAKTGLLLPGQAVSTMDRTDAQLQSGTYSGFYQVTFYNLETGDQAWLDATLNGVTVTV